MRSEAGNRSRRAETPEIGAENERTDFEVATHVRREE